MKVEEVPIGVAFKYREGVFLRISPENTDYRWWDRGAVVTLVLVPLEQPDARPAYEIAPFPYECEVELYIGDTA